MGKVEGWTINQKKKLIWKRDKRENSISKNRRKKSTIYRYWVTTSRRRTCNSDAFLIPQSKRLECRPVERIKRENKKLTTIRTGTLGWKVLFLINPIRFRTRSQSTRVFGRGSSRGEVKRLDVISRGSSGSWHDDVSTSRGRINNSRGWGTVWIENLIDRIFSLFFINCEPQKCFHFLVTWRNSDDAHFFKLSNPKLIFQAFCQCEMEKSAQIGQKNLNKTLKLGSGWKSQVEFLRNKNCLKNLTASKNNPAIALAKANHK